MPDSRTIFFFNYKTNARFQCGYIRIRDEPNAAVTLYNIVSTKGQNDAPCSEKKKTSGRTINENRALLFFSLTNVTSNEHSFQPRSVILSTSIILTLRQFCIMNQHCIYTSTHAHVRTLAHTLSLSFALSLSRSLVHLVRTRLALRITKSSFFLCFNNLQPLLKFDTLKFVCANRGIWLLRPEYSFPSVYKISGHWRSASLSLTAIGVSLS